LKIFIVNQCNKNPLNDPAPDEHGVNSFASAWICHPLSCTKKRNERETEKRDDASEERSSYCSY